MNWKSLIDSLSARNFTQEQIAEKCECAQNTISDLKAGRIKQPNYLIGTKLVALAKSKAKPPRHRSPN